MKLIQKLYKFSIIGLLFLTSCLTKEIEYDVKFEGEKIVVHGFISEDSGAEIIVKKTVPPNKPSFDNGVSAAEVFLICDDTLKIKLSETEAGKFKTPVNFKANYLSSYRIEIQAIGMNTVKSAPQILPQKVKIDTVFFDTTLSSNQPTLVLKFTDPPASGTAYYHKILEWSEGEIREEYGNSVFLDPFSVIPDDNFNGSQHSETVRVDLIKVNYIAENQYDTVILDSVQCFLYNLSPDYLTFAKSYDYYYTSLLEPLFEQPYTVFSNIENGYGFFAAYSCDLYTIKVNRNSQKNKSAIPN